MDKSQPAFAASVAESNPMTPTQQGESEMVERVAEALRRYDVSGAVSRVLARVAIEAMRDPTEDMEEAASEPFHAAWKKQRERALRLYGKEAYASAAFSDPIWKAMIDAALTPTR